VKYKPHGYQTRAIKFGVSRPNAGLLLTPGLGKTSISLAVFKLLKKQGFINRLLVLAPLRAVYSVWPKEVEKWDEFKGLSVGILHGPNKGDTLRKNHDVYVMNYEGLSWLTDNISDLKADMLVVDESSKMKETRTLRFKLLKPLLPRFKRRYILTGSPIGNSLLDLFGQMYVMDMGKALGTRFTHFREEFFFSTGYMGHDWVLKPKAEQAIYRRVAPSVLRMDAKDYLDLPPLIVKDVEITLPDKAMRIYKQMEKQLRIDFEAGTVTAANAAVASMKCRQLANGGIYTDLEHNWNDVHAEKAEAVGDIVEELSGQPAFIAYDFLHDLQRLKKVLGEDTPHIGGGVTTKRGKEIEEAWNRGELPYLLGQPQSVAHALNLQGGVEGGAVIMHSLPWSSDLYNQFIQRVWRQGQKKTVVVHRLIARGTVDEVIIKALERKDKTQNDFFSALKEYFK
jgi:SNF2 family DNA or RNA helicase